MPTSYDEGIHHSIKPRGLYFSRMDRHGGAHYYSTISWVYSNNLNEVTFPKEVHILAFSKQKKILLIERDNGVESRDLYALFLATAKMIFLANYGSATSNFNGKFGFDGNKAVARYNITRQEWDLSAFLEEQQENN